MGHCFLGTHIHAVERSTNSLEHPLFCLQPFTLLGFLPVLPSSIHSIYFYLFICLFIYSFYVSRFNQDITREYLQFQIDIIRSFDTSHTKAITTNMMGLYVGLGTLSLFFFILNHLHIFRLFLSLLISFIQIIPI